jgi:hypothetical protein
MTRTTVLHVLKLGGKIAVLRAPACVAWAVSEQLFGALDASLCCAKIFKLWHAVADQAKELA